MSALSKTLPRAHILEVVLWFCDAQMWMLGWRSLLVSMSTRRASAKAMKVQRPSRLTVVMRANMVAHVPVASMRYPEKYTMRTPAGGRQSQREAFLRPRISKQETLGGGQKLSSCPD